LGVSLRAGLYRAPLRSGTLIEAHQALPIPNAETRSVMLSLSKHKRKPPIFVILRYEGSIRVLPMPAVTVLSYNRCFVPQHDKVKLHFNIRYSTFFPFCHPERSEGSIRVLPMPAVTVLSYNRCLVPHPVTEKNKKNRTPKLLLQHSILITLRQSKVPPSGGGGG
jgi:hypothetical protein